MFITLVVFVSSSFGFPTGQNQHLTTTSEKSPSAQKLSPLQLQPVQDETKRNLQTIIKLHEQKGQTLVIQIKSRGTRRARRSRRSSQRSRRRRKMPLCMRRCLRLGMLHPAQCHSLCKYLVDPATRQCVSFAMHLCKSIQANNNNNKHFNMLTMMGDIRSVDAPLPQEADSSGSVGGRRV